MVKGQYVLCLALGVVTGCMNTDAGRENVQEYLDGFRPTVLEYASDSFVFPEGAVITPQIPRVMARLAISRCTVVPALPAGLALENTTCTFSGTPALAQAAAGYTITASNDVGSISALISIRISTPPPSSLTYTGSPYAFVKTAPITTIAPTVTGIVTSCTASPPLPGLTLNNTTCAISGFATSSQLQTTHTITASNADGSTSTTIDLTIFRVLYSASGPSGNGMANSGIADNYCNSDGNRPAGTGSYKAVIAGWGTRRACSSANCTTSGAAENLDWALAPNTQYRRNDLSTIIMTTNSAGIFIFGNWATTMVATPLPGGSPISQWTGLTSVWTTQGAGGTCGGNWSTAGGTGVYGLINRTDGTVLSYATANPCSSSSGLLACAQQ